MTAQPLPAADMELLAFERERFRSTGRKNAAILDRFGHTWPRYSQRLQAIIAKPEALAYDPELVNRLQRLTEQRRAHRTAAAR